MAGDEQRKKMIEDLRTRQKETREEAAKKARRARAHEEIDKALETEALAPGAYRRAQKKDLRLYKELRNYQMSFHQPMIVRPRGPKIEEEVPDKKKYKAEKRAREEEKKKKEKEYYKKKQKKLTEIDKDQRQIPLDLNLGMDEQHKSRLVKRSKKR